MTCDNCSATDATKPAYFNGFTEYWCDACHETYYEGKQFNPHRDCELCPEGRWEHTIISGWRNKSFKVCDNCKDDLVAETDEKRQKHAEEDT